MAVSRAFDGIMSKSLGLFGLADHGTELNTSQSDRLMMTAAGNTTSVTQRAVAPLVAGVTQPEKFLSALDIPMSKETIAEKGYVVATGDWTTNQDEGTILTEVSFPTVLKSANYAINGLLSYHQYIRCGIDVLVQINPTEWQVGGLVAWIESCQDNTMKNFTNFNNIATYPSGFLNCNVNNEIRIKQPFVFTRNHFMLHDSSTQPEELFFLRMAVWSKLSVATGTSTIVSYKVTAMLRDVTMHGIRIHVPQMIRSNYGYKASPGVQIDHGIGMMNCSNMQELRINAHMTMGCEEFLMDASMAGGVESRDFKLHLQTPCRFSRITWSTTQSAGTHLGFWKVHPRQPHNTYSTWQGGKCSTNLSLISSMYRYWRGDIVYNFQVFASKWHSGRLIVAFTPGPQQMLKDDTSLKVVSTCTAAEYDIHGPQSTFSFRVPFVSSLQYMDCDPKKGYTGYVHIYVYNQLAAPNTVSNSVFIVVTNNAGDNFELFVPSYNAPQAGGDGEDVPDVSKEETVDHGSKEPATRDFKQGPMGAMEMPQYKPTSGGVFPELKDGERLHKKTHTDLQVLLGRAHHWVTVLYSSSQSFIHDEAINWTTIPGFWQAISRCFTLFRGGLKLIIHAETFFDCELYVAFRPSGIEPITSLESLMKYGMVSFSTDQTHQVVLKLPWYQPLAANSVFSVNDGGFGYVTVGGTNGGSIKLHYSLAFDEDSHFYFPRGCPVDSAFTPATRSRALRYTRALPNAVSHQPDELYAVGPRMTPTVDALLDWAPSELPRDVLRSSVARRAIHTTDRALPAVVPPPRPPPRTNISKAVNRLIGTHRPQAKAVGHWLCTTPDAKWPLMHYFIRLEDGRQFGFYPRDDKWVDHGEVREEFHTNFERVCPADPMVEVLPMVVGPYYRAYHIMSFNCEHFARGFAGLGEYCTQLQALSQILGMTVGAVTSLPMVPQMADVKPDLSGLDQDEGSAYEDVEIPELEKEATALGPAQWELDAAIASSGQPQGWRDLMNSITPKKKDKAPEPPAGTTPWVPLPRTKKSWLGKKLGKAAKESVEPVLKDASDNIMQRAHTMLTKWVETVLKPSLTESGVKIAKLVIAAVSKLVQVGAMIYTIATHPVPAVIGPMVAIAAMEGLHGLGRYVLKDRNLEQSAESDVDVSEELFSIVYETVGAMVPQASTSGGFKEFMATVKNMSIMASGVRSIVVLGQWLVKAATAVVNWLMPSSVAQGARSLQQEAKNVAAFLAAVNAIDEDGGNVSSEALSCLEDMGSYFWRLSISAAEVIKNRSLVHQIEKAYSKIRNVRLLRTANSSGALRMEPIVVWLHGAKGSGKSLASMAIAAAVCRKLGVDPKTNIYTKPVSAKYYDGYTGQKVMIMDDVGQNVGPNATDFDDFCQMVSTAPLRLNMARLEEKGALFTTPIIIASSNIASPAPNAVNDKDAIARRIADHKFLVVPAFAYQKKVPGSGDLQTPSCVLDITMAMKDDKIRLMSCCEFHPGTTIGKKQVTLHEIVDGLMAAYNRKTTVHSTLMDMWFSMVEQQTKERAAYVDYTPSPRANTRVLQAVLKELEIEGDHDIKIVPTWVKTLLGVSVALALAATVFGAGAAIWAFANKSRNVSQGAYNPTSQVAVKVPRTMVPMNSQSVSDMVALLRQHTVELGCKEGGVIDYKVSGIAVRGRQVLAPKHFWLTARGMPIIIKSRDVAYEYDYRDVSPTELRWAEGEMDAVILTFPPAGMQPYKDITHHFVKAADVMKVVGSNAILVTEGAHGPTLVPETNIKYHDVTSYGVESQYTPSGVYIADACTLEGMCGSGLVSALNKLQNAIIGIHVAGNGNCATTQVVTQEMFQQVPQVGRILRVKEGPHISTSSKTKFTLSPLAPFVSSGKIPAFLYPSVHTTSDIFAQALTKYSPALLNMPDDWEAYETSFICWFKSKFGVHHGSLSLVESINGIEGLDRINVATSPGWPWCSVGMKKKDLIHWDGTQWMPSEELAAAVHEHLAQVDLIPPAETMLRGNPIATLNHDADGGCVEGEHIMTYITYYKDELRATDSVLGGKTRIIEAAPIHHVLAFRQVFGRGMAALHMAPLSTGFAPGCDIDMQANQLLFATDRYPVLFDADYKNFDGSLQPFVLRSAMRALAAVCGVDQFTADKWASLLIYSTHLFGDLRFCIMGGMPSGSPATTIINTISNFIMTYYLVRIATRMDWSDQFSKIMVFAYGDDLILMCDSGIFYPGMDMKDFGIVWANRAKRYFAATITDASKSEWPMRKTFDQLVFLKRRFLVDPDCPWAVKAALDKASIRAMLEYQHADEDFPDRLRAALRFAFAWGREYYEKIVRVINCSRVVARSLGPVVSYNDMNHDWWERMERS